MNPDFNKELSNFTKQSTVFKNLLAYVEAESFCFDLDLKQKNLVSIAVEAAFESFIIFSTLVPKQALKILAGDFQNMEHDFQSTEVQKFIKEYSNPHSVDDFILRRSRNNSFLFFTENNHEQELKDELADWKIKLEAQALDKQIAKPRKTVVKSIKNKI